MIVRLQASTTDEIWNILIIFEAFFYFQSDESVYRCFAPLQTKYLFSKKCR